MINAIRRWLGMLPDIPTPGDWIPTRSISTVNHTLTLDLSPVGDINIWVTEVPGTKSMLPVMHAGHNNILISGRTPKAHLDLIERLRVGDIVVVQSPTVYAIHRLTAISQDDKGIYYLLAGDNIGRNDPGKFRAENIKWISVGTLY